ncbi:MAG: EscR/YscR/HrcR family type III secretion system export apparatus protein, partial [Candidatus Dadabacteria bacterium]
MAFVLLLPFLVIDIVVANILVGLGMYMVSPVLISLPLKLAVFVLADGWLVLCKGIVMS